MSKIWETVKVTVIVVVLAVAVFFGVSYAMHPKSTETASKPRTTKTAKKAKKVKKTTPHKKSIKLVAVGDSLTEGVGDESEGGYVGQIKQTLTKKQHLTVTTTNAGKSGDRSDQILARINKSKKLQQTIAQADVITVTVGGNDLLQTLEGSITSNNTTKNDSTVAKAQATYANKLTQLFDKLQSLNKSASVFVFSIYNPVYVNFPNVTSITRYIAQWNNQTQTTLSRYDHSYFMDINTTLSHGQYKSAAQIRKLKEAATQTTLTNLTSSSAISSALAAKSKTNDLISTADNFHPNKKGYRVFTNKLYQTMMEHDAWLIKN